MKAKWLIGIVLVLLFSQCSEGGGQRAKKAYLGDYSDVMVVCDRPFWEGSFGDSLRILLTEYVEGAMPAQGQLDLEYVESRDFVGSAQRFRNVIHLDIGDRMSNQTANIKVTESEYAIDQLIVYAKAKTQKEMEDLLSKRYKDILKKIAQKEVERNYQELRPRADTAAMKNLAAKKGYSILVPERYSVLIDSGNVLWLSKITSIKKGDYEEYKLRDVVVHTYDYDSEDLFSLESIIASNNKMLREVTFSGEDGTYIKDQEKHEPSYSVIDTGENYKVEVKGMWTKEGAFQGGPQIQYVQLDYKNRRVIHADARIYSPGAKKREMLRELEAIVKSIKPV